MNRLHFITSLAVLFFGMMIAQAFATKYTVQVGNYYFLPAELNNIKPGDTIRWVWVDGAHTTTSKTIPSGAAPWDANITSISTFFEYVPTIPGNYSYKCTPHESMGMVASFSVESVGILERNKEVVKLTVSPNPAHGDVKVFANGVTPGKVTISVLDMSGRVVLTEDWRITSGKIETALDLSAYPRGLYYIRLTGDKVTGGQQVVLQ